MTYTYLRTGNGHTHGPYEGTGKEVRNPMDEFELEAHIVIATEILIEETDILED